MKKMVVALAAVVLPAVVWVSFAAAQDKEVLGWMEKVRLYPGGAVVRAKLDTGADYSSLNADEIVEFDKGKEKWVRFTVANRNGKRSRIERPVKRVAAIKRHDGTAERRLVVQLGVCIGSTYMEEEVNLVNRKNFTLQMLVGRSLLAGTSLIDPAMTFTTEPVCAGAPKE